MTVANTLPYYVKRVALLFLVMSSGFIMQASVSPDNPPDDIKNSVRTVVIDAGHGGKDSGSVGKKSLEKDLALNISLKLGKLIEDNVEGVTVIYTRKTDVFIELDKRAQIANENKADLFISVHVNANESTRPFGTSSHVLGLHRTGQNFDVAIRENSVILLEDDYETKYKGFDPTSEESYIMFSTIQKTFLNQSIEFAYYVQNEFRDKAQREDRGVVQQGLQVLALASMPAVLIETGFITNSEEEKFLNTDYGQDLIASAIYRAFKQYKARIDGSSNFEIAKTEENYPAETVEATPSNSANDLQFMVQIAASKNLVETSPSNFNGYKDVIVIQQGSKYKYAVGGKMSYHEALERCTTVKQDFPGAFVIAVKDNKIITLSEALEEINK